MHKWLEGLFAGEQIPEYEINSQTLEILYAMAMQSERNDSLARIATEDVKQKTEEYMSESMLFIKVVRELVKPLGACFLELGHRDVTWTRVVDTMHSVLVKT